MCGNAPIPRRYWAILRFFESFKGANMRIATQITVRSPGAKRWLAALALASVAGVSAPAIAQGDQQALVTSSQSTFSDFVRDPDMTWFRANLGKARAVLIAPEIVKAGWIFGGSGGRAVLYARDS